MRRSVVVTSGVAVAAALALWIWTPAEDDGAVNAGAGTANASADRQPPRPQPLADSSPPAPAATVPSAAPSSAPPAAPALRVAVTVAAPDKLTLGETNELVVSVGAGASEIGFTVQFDPDVLQVRAGTAGTWAMNAGAGARFAAEIPEAADRVTIRSAVAGAPAGLAAGTVATVTFHAVGPGTTSVLVTDVVVKDSAGRSIASLVSASNLAVTVDAPAPLQQRRQGAALASEPPPEPTAIAD